MWKKYSNGADEQLASVDKTHTHAGRQAGNTGRGLPPRDSAAHCSAAHSAVFSVFSPNLTVFRFLLYFISFFLACNISVGGERFFLFLRNDFELYISIFRFCQKFLCRKYHIRVIFSFANIFVINLSKIKCIALI